jgi:transmembrane sensor
VHVNRYDAAVRLLPRQQVFYTENGLGAVVSADPSTVSAWQDGLLIFHYTPLAEVVEEINRYRPGKIVLMSAELGRRPVNARFQIERVDDIMTLVRQVFGARVTSLPGGFVFLS